jgi:hypothetical protein
METPPERSRFRHYLRYAISIAAVAIGLKLGFDFGNRISGPLMGVVAAINSAVFCALILDFITERLFPVRKGSREDPRSDR